MQRIWTWRWVLAAILIALSGTAGRAQEFAIQSFDGTGRLTYGTIDDGTNYNYRVEWAPSPAGPWNEFGSSGDHWLNARPQPAGTTVTSTVPMCYRVVATRGDYMVVDLYPYDESVSFQVSYYQTLADVPGGADSDDYKTWKILMRLIPKGTFIMGGRSTDVSGANDDGLHQVTLTQDFYMGVFEVTQFQWERVMGNNPSYFNNATYYQMRPVERVSYYQIRENPYNSSISPNWPASSQVHVGSFMGRLRAGTGLSGFDLPTESQWEYACRAGTTTALNSGYNLTVQWDYSDLRMSEVGRYWYNRVRNYAPDVDTSGATATVGTYLPNAWGLYDMHGNVWEWCLDRYGTYPGAVTDPKGASSGSGYVFRGGSWYDFPIFCRSADRDFYFPYYRDYGIGFRVCCAASPNQP
jgi:formylglycine-generating enzyme required for sulfatase activity